METLTFKAFWAPDVPELCAEFLREHRKVLEDFGITNVTTNTAAWITDPNTCVVVAISDKQGMVGGIRVEIATEDRQLPIQEALQKFDPAIHMAMEGLRLSGNGEVCGLWNANRYSSKGLPSLLAFAAVSIANQIDLKTVVCLVAHYTLRHALKAGFAIIEDLGDGGTFTYPIPTIKAIAMVIPDVISLSTTSSPYRQQLLSLRLRPEQEQILVLNGEPTRLKYELCVGSRLLDLNVYRSIEEARSLYSRTA